MLRKLIFLTIAAALFAIPAAAQITLKLPKLPKPETTPTKAPQPTDTVRKGGGGGASRFEVMDDGLTYFDADAVKEYDTVLRLEKDVGWYLRSSLRMVEMFRPTMMP